MKEKVGIQVGASQETVKSVRDAIMAIINSKNSDLVKTAALEALTKACAVGNTTIHNCTLEVR